MLRGLATRLLDGYQTAAPLLTEALRQYRAQPRELDRLCRSYNLVAMELWDADTWFELASGQAQLARANGTLSWLPFALAHLAVLHIHAGELNHAEALLIEAEHVDDIGQVRRADAWAPLLAAWRGDAPTTNAAIDKVVADSSRRGEGAMLTYTEYVKAVLHNGLADYDLAAKAAYSAVASTNSRYPIGLPMSWWRPRCAAVSGTAPPQRVSDCRRSPRPAEPTGPVGWPRTPERC